MWNLDRLSWASKHIFLNSIVKANYKKRLKLKS